MMFVSKWSKEMGLVHRAVALRWFESSQHRYCIWNMFTVYSSFKKTSCIEYMSYIDAGKSDKQLRREKRELKKQQQLMRNMQEMQGGGGMLPMPMGGGMPHLPGQGAMPMRGGAPMGADVNYSYFTTQDLEQKQVPSNLLEAQVDTTGAILGLRNNHHLAKRNRSVLYISHEVETAADTVFSIFNLNADAPKGNIDVYLESFTTIGTYIPNVTNGIEYTGINLTIKINEISLGGSKSLWISSTSSNGDANASTNTRKEDTIVIPNETVTNATTAYHTKTTPAYLGVLEGQAKINRLDFTLTNVNGTSIFENVGMFVAKISLISQGE